MQAQLRLPFVFPFFPQADRIARRAVSRRPGRVANAGEYGKPIPLEAHEAVKLIQARAGQRRTSEGIVSELNALLGAEGHAEGAAEQLLNILHATVAASKR